MGAGGRRCQPHHPHALLSTRISTDVTGTSNGQEWLLWADFPIIPRQKAAHHARHGGDDPQRQDGELLLAASRAARPGPSARVGHGHHLSPMAAIITSYRFSPTGSACLPPTTSCTTDIANSPIVQHDGELYAGFGIGLYLVTRIGWRSQPTRREPAPRCHCGPSPRSDRGQKLGQRPVDERRVLQGRDMAGGRDLLKEQPSTSAIR